VAGVPPQETRESFVRGAAMTDTRTTDRRVSDERLNELIEWYVDDCNAYTEQHDADIRSLLGELAARRLADETPAARCVNCNDKGWHLIEDMHGRVVERVKCAECPADTSTDAL
jgi:hypothetical protein